MQQLREKQKVRESDEQWRPTTKVLQAPIREPAIDEVVSERVREAKNAVQLRRRNTVDENSQ